MPSRIRAAVLLAALLLATGAFARADQTYAVQGEDIYTIGTSLPPAHIVYSGTQRLSISPNAAGRRYVANATYTRHDDSGKATVHAHFVQQMTRDGDFEDRVDGDPDFLTILNQPFAIQLDSTTMRDLSHLRGSVPFEATSPLGGARLKGYLRHAASGKVQGILATGVHFTAVGPMTGSLPDHPNDSLTGTIRMDGTAYYSVHGALLVALDATLTIDGKLAANNDTAVPVKIVYHRTIRAGDGGVSWSEAGR